MIKDRWQIRQEPFSATSWNSKFKAWKISKEHKLVEHTWRPRPSWRTAVGKRIFKVVEIHGNMSFSWPSGISWLLLRIRRPLIILPLRFGFSRGWGPPDVGVVVPIITIGHICAVSSSETRWFPRKSTPRLFFVYVDFRRLRWGFESKSIQKHYKILGINKL